MTARMAVPITVYIDVPDDITEQEMDRGAVLIRDAVEQSVEDLDAVAVTAAGVAYLVGGGAA